MTVKDVWESNWWEPIAAAALQKGGMILAIVIGTWLLLKVRRTLIHNVFRLARFNQKQAGTLESLLMSVTRYIVFIISTLMILDNIGVDVGPIIAGAGVIGLAVGFGAQTLVKDLISGFFIIFEDQFSVGDYVTINNGQINGTVVSVGLRATKIRTWAQHVVVIQNSEIKISQNYNREKMRPIIHFTVAYEVSPHEIEQAVNRVSERLVSEMPHLFLTGEDGEPLEPPRLYGLTDVENNALGAKYTVICLVKDTHYWTACNVLRRMLLEELKRRGISIAYPRIGVNPDVRLEGQGAY